MSLLPTKVREAAEAAANMHRGQSTEDGVADAMFSFHAGVAWLWQHLLESAPEQYYFCVSDFNQLVAQIAALKERATHFEELSRRQLTEIAALKAELAEARETIKWAQWSLEQTKERPKPQDRCCENGYFGQTHDCRKGRP